MCPVGKKHSDHRTIATRFDVADRVVCTMRDQRTRNVTSVYGVCQDCDAKDGFGLTGRGLQPDEPKDGRCVVPHPPY